MVETLSSHESTGDKISNTINNLVKLTEDGLSKEEIESAISELNGFTEEELQQIHKGLEKKTEIEEPTRTKLLDLAQEVAIKKSNGYETLKESIDGNEKVSRFMTVFDEYIDERIKDTKLSDFLSKKEIDTTKMVLWGDLLQIFSEQGSMGVLLKGVSGVLDDLIGDNLEGKDKKQSIKSMYESIQAILNKFDEGGAAKKGVYDYFDYVLGTDSFADIYKVKQIDTKNELDFTNPEIIKSIKNGEHNIVELKKIGQVDKKEYLENIKKDTTNLGVKLEEGADKAAIVVKIFEELPEEVQKGLVDWVKEIANKYPIIGALLGILFGNEFLKDEVDTKKVSINNLLEFSKAEKTPVSGLKQDFIKDLEPKKLENFYSLLESDLDISEEDYSKEGFWKAILTGDTKDSKLLEIYTLLKGEKDKVEFSDKELEGEGFISRLNKLRKMRENKNSKKEEAALEAEIAAAKAKEQKDASKKKPVSPDQADIEPRETGTTSSEVTEMDIPDAEINPEIAKKINELNLRKSIRAIDSLPNTIDYNNKKVSISIEDNETIVLGDTKYKISLNHSSFNEVFRGIKFEDGYLSLNYGKFHKKGSVSISKGDLIGVISGLLKKDSYTKKFEEKNTTLSITKIA